MIENWRADDRESINDNPIYCIHCGEEITTWEDLDNFCSEDCIKEHYDLTELYTEEMEEWGEIDCPHCNSNVLDNIYAIHDADGTLYCSLDCFINYIR